MQDQGRTTLEHGVGSYNNGTRIRVGSSSKLNHSHDPRVLAVDGNGDDSAKKAPTPDPRSEKLVATVVIW